MKRLLTLLLLATAQSHAALSLSASNTTGVQAFGATPAAADWSTFSMGGAAGTLATVTAVDNAAQALTAATINSPLGTQTANPTNAIAQHSSNSNFIYTAPTGNNAAALMATLQNDSGAPVTAITIAYDHTRIGTAVEESMGHRVFYSLTGLANSWTLIPGLSGIGTNQALSVTISLSGAWANTTKLYLLWVDDNGSGTDTPFTIDNFVVSATNSPPVVALTTPASGAVATAPGSFALTATATDDGSVTQVEFLRNSSVIHTDSTSPYEHTDSGLAAGNYSYTARATDNLSATTTSSAVAVNVFTDPAQTALQFDGVNDYVTMGAATAALGASNFTVECWFKRTGAGAGNASTGTNGLAAAIPLVTKGRSEGDNSNIDCNYFLGLDNATGRLCADFEAATSTPLNGTGAANNNYPVFGTTVIPQNVWTHAAMTWDGNEWKLFVNGVEETMTVPNLLPTPRPVPRADSIQHFAIASALNSTGVTTGFFQGLIDEVRVWNLARTPAEIASAKNTPITSAMPGLLARYGLNEGTGGTAASSIGTIPGTLTNGPLWTDGIVLTPNTPPTVSIDAPVNNASFSAPAGFTITATAADGDGTINKVEFFSGATKIGEDFSAPYEQIVSGLAQGSYSYTAKATDNIGAVTTSSAIAVTVTPPVTTPPTVSITSPADGATFLAPATITINANAADSDGTVEKVEFFNGATKLGEDTDSPYTFNWSNVAIGSYTLTAKATDNLTANTTSSAITVNVILNQSPSVSLTAPADLATGLSGASVTLSASVSDPESQPMNVTFYGRPKSPPVGPDFTLMTLPDTQFYSENLNNRLTQFTSQVNWIVSQRNALNIAFVAHMGDMVNTTVNDQEWINADGAMDVIEDPATTFLTHGIPWGGAPGNHDIQSGNTAKWNQYFGAARWAGRPYFQGNYNSSNTNNYQFFSASGLDFIIVNLAYNSNTAGDAGVFAWADALLKAHPTRRAIITSHWIVNTGSIASTGVEATFGGHGQALYNELKDNPNLFLMLCGHVHGEGLRDDVFEGRTVYSVLQDYQDRSGAPGGFGGGDGWLRYFIFSPANNTISAKTYRTTSGAFETDADSQFTLPYTMGAGTAPWTALGTVSASGGTATLNWTGLAGNTEYEWYAAVSDGTNSVGSATRSFTAAANAAPTVSLTSPAEGATVALPAPVNFAAAAGDTDGTVSKVEFYAGAVKVGEDTGAPFEYAWTAISGSYALTAVATDNQGASTTSSSVNITVTNPNNVSPSVAITAPTSGSSVPSGTVALAANASDTDGVVSKVEFFNGAVEIGEDNTSPFTFDWLGVAAGNYTITAVATDNDGGTATSAPVSVTAVVPVSSTLIAKGATWKYLDNGTDQGSAWKETSFNDAAWASGLAVLGGGDAHIITNVNLGPAAPNRYITTYFRRAFSVTGAASVQQLNLNILRDDGVVVYINGTEVARQNMPAGAVTYQTNSVNTISGADETTYFPSSASPLPTLVDGNNTIAVEVHQRDGSSSDLGFDLELIATSLSVPPTVTLVASDAAAGEFGADQAIGFTVTRTGSTTASLNVPLVVSGSAAQGVDYTGFLSSIAIPVGQASTTLPLTVQADNEAEGAETATVSLGASAAFVAGTPASADAIIADKPEQGFYFANIANPAKRAPGMDADGDANANVIEYFMGSLPGDANSRGVLEIPTTGTNTFKVRYPRAKNRADVGGSLRWSGNLTNWHNSGQSNGTHTVTFVEAVVSASGADPEIIEATATITGPGEASSIFVRLGVQ